MAFLLLDNSGIEEGGIPRHLHHSLVSGSSGIIGHNLNLKDAAFSGGGQGESTVLMPLYHIAGLHLYLMNMRDWHLPAFC